MKHSSVNRRDFLKTSTAAAAGATMPYWFSTSNAHAFNFQNPNDRPIIGCIGTGDRWYGGVGPNALQYGDCVAVADVDANHAQNGKKRVKEYQAKKGIDNNVDVYEDYRKILERDDIEIVTIVTPDHWHSKIAIEAMQAGKDVYCEKPLTLTIHEGKQIRKVLDETGRVFQVGTQQRSEMGQRFIKAVAMIRDGRIGKVKRVTCDIGGAPESGVIPKAPVPEGLNWDFWLGQAPEAEYVSKPAGNYPASRCHYEFRWWYEYSGGKMTDWGAHHVDIAQWAMGMDHTGPISVEGLEAVHPVEMKDGYATKTDQYNTATKFRIRCMFENDIELLVVSDSPDGNGILFEGTEGRFHVSRGSMKGAPVEELETNPITEEQMVAVYKGKQPGDHMRNFYECVVSREQPISDVHTHHRAMTTCHLSNIAIRLGEKLTWDPKAEKLVGDDSLNQWLSREQRKGYEINVSV